MLNYARNGTILKHQKLYTKIIKSCQKQCWKCLKNINLDIKSGETIGIIDGTGSGKFKLHV